MARHPLIPTPGAGGIRSVVVGGGHGGFPGFPGGYGFDDDEAAEPIKKFSTAEAKDALVQKIQDEPHLIQDHISLVTSDAKDTYRSTLWPAAIDSASWTRLSTHRPTEDAEGNKITGTDLEVRKYENDVWLDHGHQLEAEVHTEFGEVKEILVKCSW